MSEIANAIQELAVAVVIGSFFICVGAAIAGRK